MSFAPAASVFGVVPTHVPPTAPPTALIFTRVSVNAPPVIAEAFELLKVSVTVELPPGAIVFGANPFAIVGEAKTVRLAVLLAGPAVGVCVVVTPDVEFGCMPGVLLVTAKVTVQELLAGMLIPVKLNAVAPAASVFGVVPTQVPPTAPPTALILLSVSVNAAPVSAEALLLLKVSVTVELPPTWIEAGTKAFAMVGGARTVRLAVLLTAPATANSAVVAPEVALGRTPGVLLVTSKMTVQLLFKGIVIPLKFRLVAPVDKLLGVVPVQVPVTAPPTALIFVSVSVKETLVRAMLLSLLSISVTVEVPPT
jgi:hypothetical protein